jgi:hypothetical protein
MQTTVHDKSASVRELGAEMVTQYSYVLAINIVLPNNNQFRFRDNGVKVNRT